jgi:hypothetical protein
MINEPAMTSQLQWQQLQMDSLYLSQLALEYKNYDVTSTPAKTVLVTILLKISLTVVRNANWNVRIIGVNK